MPDLPRDLHPDPSPVSSPSAVEIDLLTAQHRRMRAMQYRYSAMFFSRILAWTLVAIALLLVGWARVVPGAVAFVPFVVPFAFLETGYLFFYTVFARRHAARLERAIGERLGRELLVAHRLEDAYFFPLDAPKLAALSTGNLFGYPSVMTAGYALGAALLWLAGLVGTIDWAATAGGGVAALVAPASVVWTAAIVVALCWLFIGGRDERRLVAALEDSYRS